MIDDRFIYTVNGVLDAVRAERVRQQEKWGQQDWPDGTGSEEFESNARAAKQRTDEAAQDGSITYAHILEEEFWEALAESDKSNLRTELIQGAAVMVAWVEKIDREEAQSNQQSAE